MALSRQHACLIAPALLAESLIAFAIYQSASLVAGVEPEFRPSYAQDLAPWLLWIAFWQTLRVSLTTFGLLTCRVRLWWLPIAAAMWELYAFVKAVDILANHLIGVSDLFTIHLSDLASVLFLPFVIAVVAPFVVIPTLALRAHGLVSNRYAARQAVAAAEPQRVSIGLW